MASVSPDEQSAWCRRAAAGDRAAAARLYELVLPSIRRKAAEYSRRFHRAISTDDLIGAANVKFQAAVRTYKPRRGIPFKNYFITVASREMVKVGARAYRERQAHPQAPPDATGATATEVLPARPDDATEALAAAAGLAALPACERLLFTALSGTNGRRRSAKTVAAALGVPPGDVTAVFDAVREKLRRQLARTDARPRHRPPDPAGRPIVAAAQGLRSRGLGWKQVAGELSRQYGRPISPDALRVRVARANCEHK